MQKKTNHAFVSLASTSLDGVSGGMNLGGHGESLNMEDCRTGTCYIGGNVPIATGFFDGNFWREQSTVTTGDFARFDRDYSGEGPDLFPNAIDFNLIVDSGESMTVASTEVAGGDAFATGSFDGMGETTVASFDVSMGSFDDISFDGGNMMGELNGNKVC